MFDASAALAKPKGSVREMSRAAEAGSSPERDALFDRRTIYEGFLVFVAAWAILFLLSSRIVNGFDEGIFLTATMRTMAGQVLHRDFYYNYGPAQVYLLGGLFKLFGPSVLVERLTDTFFCSCLMVTLYELARRFCSRVIAIAVVVVGMLWLIGLLMVESMMNPALCMLILWASLLILPRIDDVQQRRRALCAGFLAAIMFLFRYDMGLEIVVANLMAVLIIRWLEEPALRRSMGGVISLVIGPYIAAFAITVAPAAIAYLSVARLHDLLFDTVLYGGNQYRLGRHLPFPIPRLGPTFQEVAVYLLPITIALSLWVVSRWVITRRRAAARSASHVPDWMNLLVALSIATTILCTKGLIRVGIGGMYGSLMACLLMAAILFQHRAMLNIWLRGLLTATIALFVLTAASSAQIQFFYQIQLPHQIHLKPLAINWIVTPDRQPPSPAFRSWCQDDTPITRGFCFLLSEEQIQVVRYLDAHTRPGDYFYEGLSHHDRILMNDTILYFAAQRLPAVRWSQLDPLVENQADIQKDMIGGLEQHKPPYVVLDSEFENLWEPNGSAVSTGVHLLDDYIAAHYKRVQQYGTFTILQRQEPAGR